jgi:hypothetical protein
MAAKTLLTTAFAAAALAIAVPALGAQTLTEQGDMCFALRGERGKAREALEHVLAMEPHPDLIPETAEEREMARKRLEGRPFKAKK